MTTEAAWTHNSKINGKMLNPSNPLWVRQCILIRDVSPCPCPCGVVLEKSLFYQFSFEGSKPAQLVLKTVAIIWDMLPDVLELNGFTAKSAIVSIRLYHIISVLKVWFADHLCSWAHRYILVQSLFRVNLSYNVTMNFINKHSWWWRK